MRMRGRWENMRQGPILGKGGSGEVRVREVRGGERGKCSLYARPREGSRNDVETVQVIAKQRSIS
jgi:hypothetical protein